MDVVLKFTPAKFHMKFYVLSTLWREIKYPKIRQNRLRKGLWSYMLQKAAISIPRASSLTWTSSDVKPNFSASLSSLTSSSPALFSCFGPRSSMLLYLDRTTSSFSSQRLVTHLLNSTLAATGPAVAFVGPPRNPLSMDMVNDLTAGGTCSLG